VKIEDVALYRVTGAEGDTPGTFRGVSHSDQLDLYPDIAKNKDNLSERPAKPALSALYVEVQAENGLSGLFGLFGPIQESQAYVIEFLIRTQPQKQFFHKPLYWPERGSLRSPELPGLGLVLDAKKMTKKERVSFDLIGKPI